MKKLISNNKKPWLLYYNNIPDSIKYPDISMYELVNKAAMKYPYFSAYSYFGKECNYKQFMVRIDEAAKGFKALGVEKNDKVTICMPNTPQAIISFYAINKIGAIACMIHPLSSENEIENYIKSSCSKVVVTVDVVFEKVKESCKFTSIQRLVVAPISVDMKFLTSVGYYFTRGRKINVRASQKVIPWNEFIDDGYEYLGSSHEKVHGNDPALILYSGGTTGRPKGIVLSNLNFNAEAMGAHIMCDPSKEGDSVLSIMPIFHGFGLAVCIHTPLITGMKCILVPEFSSKKFYKLIKKYKPNFLVGVPTLFEILINNKKIRKNDLSCVTCVVSGGDNLSATLKHKVDLFLLEHGSLAELRQGYGLTESSGATCLSPTKNYRDGTIGIPFPDTLYKIVKIGTNEEVPFGSDGEICISGPTVMLGYLDNEKETAQALRKHDDNLLWLHTGDIGSMDSSGYVYFKQRLKRIIISSGYNIYPSFIEEVLNRHPSVLTSTIIGIKHPYKNQVVKAFIVLKEDIKLTDKVKKNLKEYLKQNIPEYTLPYKYEFRKSLPKTLVGKVAYKELEDEEKKGKK